VYVFCFTSSVGVCVVLYTGVGVCIVLYTGCRCMHCVVHRV